MAHGTDHGVDHHLPSENDPRFWTSRLLETLNASFKLCVYFKILIIYLVVAGLGCGRSWLWQAGSSLCHVGCFVAAQGLSSCTCGLQSAQASLAAVHGLSCSVACGI